MDANNPNDPIPIVTIENNIISWHKDAFETCIRRAEGKNIFFFSIHGGYQKGKSSTIAYMFGNKNYKFGDGRNETTVGATIDGPYSIKNLLEKWDLEINYNVSDDDVLFVIDIEGWGGSLRGQYGEFIYSKLSTVFIPISDIVILLSDPQEQYNSMSNILSSMNLNNHESNVVLFQIIRNIKKISNELNYSNPNFENYQQISNILESEMEGKYFSNIDYTVVTRPLPNFDNDFLIFEQNEQFKTGFKFIVFDLINIIMDERRIRTVNNIDQLVELFTSCCDLADSDDFNSISQVEHNCVARSIKERMNEIYENINVDNILIQFVDDQRNIDLQNDWQNVRLNEDDNKNFLIQKLISLLDENIQTGFNPINFENARRANIINNEKDQIIQIINDKINNQINQITMEINNIYFDKVNNMILDSINPLIQNKIARYINNHRNINLATYQFRIVLNQNDIQNELYDQSLEILTDAIANLFNRNLLENENFVRIIDSTEDQVRRYLGETISNQIEQITADINDIYSNKIQSIVLHFIDQIIPEKINQYVNDQRNKQLIDNGHTIVLERNAISTILYRQINRNLDENINILFANQLFESYEFVQIFEREIIQIDHTIVTRINQQMNQIMRNIENIIIRKAENIVNIIGNFFCRFVRKLNEEMVKKNIFHAVIIDDKNDLFEFFDKMMIPLADFAFEEKGIHYYEGIERIRQLKDNMHKKIEDEINDIIPDLFEEMKSKRFLNGLQKFGKKFLMIFGFTVAVCTPIGALTELAFMIASASISSSISAGIIAGIENINPELKHKYEIIISAFGEAIGKQIDFNQVENNISGFIRAEIIRKINQEIST